MKLNIGMIGAGGIAGAHLTNLATEREVRIAAICDIDAPKAEKLAAQYGAAAYADCRLMLQAEELDAVFVCTPPGFRLQPIEAAAARGLPCFVEKPPAWNMEEANRIGQIVRKSGIVCMVGFMYRYAEAVTCARELTADRPPAIIRSHFVCGSALTRAAPGWFYLKEKSGGPVFDQAIHVLDAVRYLAGEAAGPVAEVYAQGSNKIVNKADDFTIEDSHAISVRYQDGTLHTHIHSWAVDEAAVQIELMHRDYRLLIDLYPLPERRGSRLSGFVGDREILHDFPDDPFYITEERAFLQAVRNRSMAGVRSPFADAARTLELVLAANRSVDERQVVFLNRTRAEEGA